MPTIGLPVQRVRRVGDRTPGGRLITENARSSQSPVPAGEEQPDYYLLADLDHIGSRPPESAEFLRRHDSGINVVGEFRRMNGGFQASGACCTLRVPRSLAGL